MYIIINVVVLNFIQCDVKIKKFYEKVRLKVTRSIIDIYFYLPTCLGHN